MPFLKAIPQQILDIGKVHNYNYWILKGPANTHKCQQFSNRSWVAGGGLL
jgi:hypothetical protein